MDRKYLNYAIFLAIVAVVVGIAVKHSRDMQNLVDTMAGSDRAKRIKAAKELVIERQQFMDSITGETVPKRVKIVQALEDWAIQSDKEATKQLVGYLKDPDKPVRDRILLALLAVGARSEDNLNEVVAGIKDGDGNVRKYSITALQILGQTDPAQAEPLIRRALPDANPESIRKALAHRDPAVAAKIIAKVVDLMKKEDAARGPGGDVLGALKDQREESVAALLPLLKEKDEGVVKGAVTALGKVGSKTAIPALIPLMDPARPQVRRLVIGAIALIADPSGEAQLVEALNNPDDDNEARAQAAVGLGIIATPTAIATLIRALRDYDTKVQTAAVSALARAGKPAIRPLLQALKDPDAAVRRRAAQALGGIASPETNPGLIAALSDADVSVRLAAINALGFNGNTGAVGALAKQMADSDSAIAAAAAEALARVGEAARPTLAKALSSGSETVAYYAAQALAKQGPMAVPTIQLEAARNPVAARWGAMALGQIGGREAVTALKAIAQGTDADAREIAQQSLKKLGVL